MIEKDAKTELFAQYDSSKLFVHALIRSSFANLLLLSSACVFWAEDERERIRNEISEYLHGSIYILIRIIEFFPSRRYVILSINTFLRRKNGRKKCGEKETAQLE